jgi:hypothetical protein
MSPVGATRTSRDVFTPGAIRYKADELSGIALTSCNHEPFNWEKFGKNLRATVNAPRSTHANNRGMMFFAPRLPGSYTLLLLCLPLLFRKGVPCGHSRAVFAAKENSEKCIVRAHKVSFPLRVAG